MLLSVRYGGPQRTRASGWYDTAQGQQMAGKGAVSAITAWLDDCCSNSCQARCHTARCQSDRPIEPVFSETRSIENDISKRGIQMLAVSISVVSLLTSASSLACGGDWYPEVHIDPRIRGVAEAEKTLAKANYIAAAGSVVRMIPQIETLLGQSPDPLLARAARVLSVAIAREGGKLSLEREVPAHWLGKSKQEEARAIMESLAARDVVASPPHADAS